MSENEENLFTWQRPLRDSNPIWQQSLTPVGLSAGEKTAKIGCVLFEQIRPEGVVQTGSSFGSQGHPRSLRMVPLDRIQNCLQPTHSFPGTTCPSRIVLELWQKNEISENESWLLWHTHTHTHPFNGPFPGLPRLAGTRKVKPIWILLEQETVSGSGISWAICKSAPHPRQITMPAPHHSVFYRPDALPASQPTASKH